MFGLIKKTLRIGVIGALTVGLTAVAAFAALGEGRTKTVVRELHGHVIETIDDAIDDPTALRSQLHDMEREYPERIAQVRGDLVSLESEIRELSRDQKIAQRVVAMVDNDLGQLEGALANHTTTASNGNLTPVRTIQVNDRLISPQRAQSKLHQMREQKLVYANRAADAEHALLYLEKQRGRLQELLAKLETERAEFQTQILGLTRQIDAIARNDRLIGLLDKRNRTIEECSRYEAISLDQITGRLAEITNRQEAELDLLANVEEVSSYEDLARLELAGESYEAQCQSLEAAASEY